METITVEVRKQAHVGRVNFEQLVVAIGNAGQGLRLVLRGIVFRPRGQRPGHRLSLLEARRKVDALVGLQLAGRTAGLHWRLGLCRQDGREQGRAKEQDDWHFHHGLPVVTLRVPLVPATVTAMVILVRLVGPVTAVAMAITVAMLAMMPVVPVVPVMAVAMTVAMTVVMMAMVLVIQQGAERENRHDRRDQVTPVIGSGRRGRQSDHERQQAHGGHIA